MRWLFIAAGFALSPAAPAADSIYISPDGAFQFRFSRSLAWCHEVAGDRNRWEPSSLCMSHEPMCHEHAIACLAYPGNEYKGYNFVAAALSISRITALNEGEDDLARYCHSPEPRIEHGVKFVTRKCVEGALGSYYYTELYRTCHGGACYELDLTIATTEYSNYHPGAVKEFKAGEWKNVTGRLKRMVDTLQFLK